MPGRHPLRHLAAQGFARRAASATPAVLAAKRPRLRVIAGGGGVVWKRATSSCCALRSVLVVPPSSRVCGAAAAWAAPRALLAQAREMAPDYAVAQMAESDLEEQRADLGCTEDPVQGRQLAERAARQAPAESERARALNPSDSVIAEWRAHAQLWTGSTLVAVALLECALKLDPAGRRCGR